MCLRRRHPQWMVHNAARVCAIPIIMLFAVEMFQAIVALSLSVSQVVISDGFVVIVVAVVVAFVCTFIIYFNANFAHLHIDVLV